MSSRPAAKNPTEVLTYTHHGGSVHVPVAAVELLDVTFDEEAEVLVEAELLGEGVLAIGHTV